MFGAYLLRTLKEDDYLDYYEIGKRCQHSLVAWSPFKKYAEQRGHKAIFNEMVSGTNRLWYNFNDKLIGVIEFHILVIYINSRNRASIKIIGIKE